MISKQTLTFGIHLLQQVKLARGKFVNWHWLCSYIKFVRIATFIVDCEYLQSGLNPTTKLLKNFIGHYSCDYVPILRNCNPWWAKFVEKVVK